MTAPTMPGRPYGSPDVLVETRRAIAWDGVIAGSLVGLAVTICLSLAGAAMGLTLVDPWAKTPSVTALGFGAMIWLFIVNMLGMGIGGYIAGRSAHSESALDEATMNTPDFRFRCAAHGLTVWAIATVTAGILGVSAVTGALGFATQTVAMTAGAAGGAAGVAAMADDDSSDLAFHVRQLFGPQVASGQGQSTQQRSAAPAPAAAAAAPATPIAPGAPTTAASPSREVDFGDDTMDEAGYIMERAWQRNGLAPSEKTYLAGLLARHSGISQADAEQRVGEAEQRLKTAVAQAETEMKNAADKAAKASALATFFAFLSLAVGAVAAGAGALSCTTRRFVVVRR